MHRTSYNRSQVSLYKTSTQSGLQHRVRMRRHSNPQALTLRHRGSLHRLHLNAPKVILGLDVRAVHFCHFDLAGELLILSFETDIDRLILVAINNIQY